MPTPKPLLMGSEIEYSVASRCRDRHFEPEHLADWISQVVRKEFVSLCDAGSSSGVFLENGSRLYTDIHGHPEYATPECSTPEQVAAYDKAGERIVLKAAQHVRRERKVEFDVLKNNIGAVFPGRVTWGNHESYTSWIALEAAAEAMVPHLVTRLAYAGSGTLSARSPVGYELSQRARHIADVIGPETTHSRAIFCTRIRKTSDASGDGWTRAHLISKDSQRAPFGIYLSFATTGMLFWILNHGGPIGKRLRLADPLAALRQVSTDPFLKVRLRLADGRCLTPIEIQHEYAAECETFARHAEFPEWGGAALRHWQETLEALQRDPLELAPRLDTYAKLSMIRHELSRSGYDERQLQRSLSLLERVRQGWPSPSVMRALLAENTGELPAEERPDYSAAQAMVSSAGAGALEGLRFALRLQVLDLKYHELGGLYDRLLEAGHFDPAVISDAEVEQAVTEPPAGGRAALRAAFVKAHDRQRDWTVSWDCIANPASGAALDLRDPFATEARDVPIETFARSLRPW